MLEIKRTSWQENFNETCQDILEDAFLLDALSQYVTSDGSFMQEFNRVLDEWQILGLNISPRCSAD